MTTTFRKTAKGVEEIATRAHGLTPRLRSALILVDGSRNDTELGKLIASQATETLKALVNDGYIEVISVAPPPPKPAKPNDKAAGTGGFEAYRSEAVRAFNDLVGPRGEVLALRMEKVSSREQLAPLLQLACEIIEDFRGHPAANEFKARFASF